MEGERIEFPRNIVNMWDIAKGAGGAAISFLFDRHRHGPLDSESGHYRGATRVIDEALYDQDTNRWDDQGNWTNPYEG